MKRKNIIIKAALLIYITATILWVCRDEFFPADVRVGQVWVLDLTDEHNPFENKLKIKLHVVAVSKYYVKSLRYIDGNGDSVLNVDKRRIFRYGWVHRIK